VFLLVFVKNRCEKFSFRKIKYGSSRCFSSSSLAVFIGTALPHFPDFAGGFPCRLRRQKLFELFQEYCAKFFTVAVKNYVRPSEGAAEGDPL